jgi:hypothetical protein
METKICRVCGEEKSVDDFYWTSASHQKLENRCKKCQHQASEPSRIKRLYNISTVEYEELFRKQNGRCAICRVDPGDRKLNIDHDHVTGETRGLLCNDCNHGICKFDDNSALLRIAALYLDAATARRKAAEEKVSNLLEKLKT